MDNGELGGGDDEVFFFERFLLPFLSSTKTWKPRGEQCMVYGVWNVNGFVWRGKGGDLRPMVLKLLVVETWDAWL